MRTMIYTDDAIRQGIEQGPTLWHMVTENLMLERQQVVAYTALIRKVIRG
jgi:hypothetical protein